MIVLAWGWRVRVIVKDEECWTAEGDRSMKKTSGSTIQIQDDSKCKSLQPSCTRQIKERRNLNGERKRLPVRSFNARIPGSDLLSSPCSNLHPKCLCGIVWPQNFLIILSCCRFLFPWLHVKVGEEFEQGRVLLLLWRNLVKVEGCCSAKKMGSSIGGDWKMAKDPSSATQVGIYSSPQVPFFTSSISWLDGTQWVNSVNSLIRQLFTVPESSCVNSVAFFLFFLQVEVVRIAIWMYVWLRVRRFDFVV